MSNPIRITRVLATSTAAFGMFAAGCGEASTEPDWRSSLEVTAQVSRSVLKSGDSTTITVSIRNKSNRTVIAPVSSNCWKVTFFEVLKDNVVAGPGGRSSACSAIGMPPDRLAPGAVIAHSFVWRGSNEDWAVQLSPGVYSVRGLYGYGDEAIRSEPVLLQIQ